MQHYHFLLFVGLKLVSRSLKLDIVLIFIYLLLCFWALPTILSCFSGICSVLFLSVCLFVCWEGELALCEIWKLSLNGEDIFSSPHSKCLKGLRNVDVREGWGKPSRTQNGNGRLCSTAGQSWIQVFQEYGTLSRSSIFPILAFLWLKYILLSQIAAAILCWTQCIFYKEQLPGRDSAAAV